MMLPWVLNTRLGQSVMNVALVVGFLAALSFEKWPQFSWLAEAVIVFVTVVAMVVYFVRKCYGEKVERSADNTEDNKVLDKRTTQDIYRRTVVLAQGSDFNVDHNVVLNRPIMQGDIERWLREAVKPGPATLQEYRKVLIAHHNLVAHRVLAARDAETVRLTQYDRRLKKLEDDIKSIIRVTEPDKNAPGRLVVGIGPVTIEIKDDETKVHVTTATPVITNVSGTEESSKKVLDEMIAFTSPTSRLVH